MKKIIIHPVLKKILVILLLLFAAEGFILTASFFAIKLHLFNDPGSVDKSDRYFHNIEKAKEIQKIDVSKNEIPSALDLYTKLNILNAYYPVNALLIHKAFQQHENVHLAMKMLDAVNYELIDNKVYTEEIQEKKLSSNKHKAFADNAFEWMNIIEWEDFKIAVKKDSILIDSVAKQTGVEARMIVAVLLGEQMRLFNSTREVYKTVISPLKILSVESKFSLGVTGIKEATAMKTEQILKDPASEFYIGKKYEHLLDFSTSDTAKERFERLVNYRNHYYSYLYAALIIKMTAHQWKAAGFDISERPEILATLYNVGYQSSKPKTNPSVGGSNVSIHDKNYSFGTLGYQFYYSGELMKIFPYTGHIISE